MLVRLLRTHLRPYRRLLLVVLGLQSVQTIAAPLPPDLNADIIDKGVVPGDTGYIWRLGGVMLAVTARPGRVRGRPPSTSAPGSPWPSAATSARSLFHRVTGFSAREVAASARRR